MVNTITLTEEEHTLLLTILIQRMYQIRNYCMATDNMSQYPKFLTLEKIRAKLLEEG